MDACLDAWGDEMATAVDGGHVLDGNIARCIIRQSKEISGKMRDVVVTFELSDQMSK